MGTMRDERPRTAREEFPVANTEGASVYSMGWTSEDPRVFTLWLELAHPPGALALSVYELGGGLHQDLKPRIVSGPDR